MSVQPRPNLFIIGAPKCGTTGLYTYLRNHPEVFMSPMKEPDFFASDVCGHQRKITSVPEYLNCFSGANGEKTIGEASVAYLSSRTAPQEIKAFSPASRIIIMLRNPVDVMHAQHSQRIFDNMEHIRDFEAAVDSEQDRKWRSGRFKGEKIIRPGYREVAQFSGPVRRYLDIFGRENVNVVIYDDVRSDTAAAYGEVLRFLQLGPIPEVQCPVVNANRRVRNMAIQEFVRHPPKLVRRLARTVMPQNLRSGTGEFLRRLNTVCEPAAPLSENLRRRLAGECKPDIEELSSLLGRDLSHWYTAPGVAVFPCV